VGDGIIGALYERGRCRGPQEIPRGRQPWNPTLQKTRGGAPGRILTAYFLPSQPLGPNATTTKKAPDATTATPGNSVHRLSTKTRNRFSLSRCSLGRLVRERGMSSSYRKRIILLDNLSALAVARLAEQRRSNSVRSIRFSRANPPGSSGQDKTRIGENRASAIRIVGPHQIYR